MSSTYIVIAPAYLVVGVPSTFTIVVTGAVPAAFTVTPVFSGTGGLATITPTPPVLVSASGVATFTATVAQGGSYIGTYTNSGSLTNPGGPSLAAFNAASITMASATCASDGQTITIPCTGVIGSLSPTSAITSITATVDGNAATFSAVTASGSTITAVLTTPITGSSQILLTMLAGNGGNLTDTALDCSVGQANFPVTTTSTGGLITITRAIQNAQLSALNISNPTLLASLISAASKLIQKYCHRLFNVTSLSEYYNGGWYNNLDPLCLEQLPVLSISRLSINPQTVITITNTSTANQRATVATIPSTDGLSCSSLTLVTVASAVSSTTTLSTTTYPTIAALVAAINGIGSGWSALANPGYSLYASADLRTYQGAISALTPSAGAQLLIFIENLTPYLFGSGDFGTAGEWNGQVPQSAWALDAKRGVIYGTFPPGQQNVRIDYIAGFADAAGNTLIPDDLQEAVVQTVVFLYLSGTRDYTMKSEGLGPYRYELAANASLPQHVRDILSRYWLPDKVTA